VAAKSGVIHRLKFVYVFIRFLYCFMHTHYSVNNNTERHAIHLLHNVIEPTSSALSQFIPSDSTAVITDVRQRSRDSGESTVCLCRPTACDCEVCSLISATNTC